MKKEMVMTLLLLPLSSGLLHAEGDYSLGIGAEYSSGDYGTGDTATLWSFPLALNYRADGWGWGVSVPYLILNSSGNVVVGSGGMIGASQSVSGSGGGGAGGGMAGSSATTTETGIGDVTLRGSLRLAEEGRLMPWMGITLKAKLATADETRFLGTGENDYSMQLELAKGPVDGYVGYKYLGDPAYVDFNNVAYGAVAYSFKGGDATRYTVEGYLEQPAIDGNDPKREASVILQHRLDSQRRISGFLMKGFSDASPDWGGGVALRYDL